MRITTWNVNGIRSLKKSVDCVLKELDTDIACFQETKVSRNQIPETTALVESYTSYFSYPRKHSGYSGVATYCKDVFVPEDAEENLSTTLSIEDNANILDRMEPFTRDGTEFDSEGRVMTTYHLIRYGTEIKRLAVINVYCPCVDPDKPERHVYKILFCLFLEAKVHELCKKGCAVIILGDLNIAVSMIDHCDPGNEREFNSSEARKWLKALLSSKISYCDENIGVIDAFRHFYPDKKNAYTCWNTKTNARLTNYGTRIDYILISSNLLPLLQSCEILSDYHGSDHCPVTAFLKCDSIPENKAQLPAICTRLWPEFSGQQQKLGAFFQKMQKIADNVTGLGESEVQNKNKSSKKKDKQKSITNFFKVPSGSSQSNFATYSKEQNLCEEQSTSVNGVHSNSNNSISHSVNLDTNENIVKTKQSTAWKSMLSGPPKPPLCKGHQKECVLRTVKKKGPNYGRNFFMCSQPAGHSANPDSNCNFFQWMNPPKINKLDKK